MSTPLCRLDRRCPGRFSKRPPQLHRHHCHHRLHHYHRRRRHHRHWRRCCHYRDVVAALSLEPTASHRAPAPPLVLPACCRSCCCRRLACPDGHLHTERPARAHQSPRLLGSFQSRFGTTAWFELEPAADTEAAAPPPTRVMHAAGHLVNRASGPGPPKPSGAPMLPLSPEQCKPPRHD
jgi:hypothetical protein